MWADTKNLERKTGIYPGAPGIRNAVGEPNDFHKSREKFPVFHEKTGEKVLTEAVFGCYDTQVSDRKEEADPYGERPPRPLHDDGGDAHASMRMMRRAQNTGSFGLRFVC